MTRPPIPPSRLLPNLGAEDGRTVDVNAPMLRGLLCTWQRIAPAHVMGFAGLNDEARTPFQVERTLWPPATGRWLVPWLVDSAAVQCAAQEGRRLHGPDPAVVRTVHDKAFAHAVVTALKIDDDTVALGQVIDADAFADPDRVARDIAARVSTWPLAVDAFTLKPRIGTTGRGRVAGHRGRPLLPHTLGRFLRTGGAVLEPWRARTVDLGAALLVHGPDDVDLLGTTVADVSASGVWRGARGQVTAGGTSSAAVPVAAAFADAALRVGRAVAATGFHGPMGVDAFVYRDQAGTATLRSVVEVNARITAGFCAIAAAATAGLSPGTAFHFTPADGLVLTATQIQGAPTERPGE